jgi:hypothetical protein
MSLELFVARFSKKQTKQQKRSKAMVTKNPLAGTDILTEVLIEVDIFRDVMQYFGRNLSSDKSQNSTELNLK